MRAGLRILEYLVFPAQRESSSILGTRMILCAFQVAQVIEGVVNDGSARQNTVHACLGTTEVSKACFRPEKMNQARRNQRGSPSRGVREDVYVVHSILSEGVGPNEPTGSRSTSLPSSNSVSPILSVLEATAPAAAQVSLQRCVWTAKLPTCTCPPSPSGNGISHSIQNERIERSRPRSQELSVENGRSVKYVRFGLLL